MSTFYTGNSGRSTGPHLDFRVWSHETGGYVDPRPFTSYVSSGGAGVDQWTMTSPYGADRGSYIHQGIDYATEMGTPIEIQGGRYLTTFDDSGGGGITSQYEIVHSDGKKYDILLMHGNDQNSVLSQSAVTDGVSLANGSGPTPSAQPTSDETDGAGGTQSDRPGALERVKNYQEMSKAELDSAYDTMRAEDPVKAGKEGLAMHRAYFNKK